MPRAPGFEWVAHLTDSELARLKALVVRELHGVLPNAEEEREMADLERVAKERMATSSRRRVITSPVFQRLINRWLYPRRFRRA